MKGRPHPLKFYVWVYLVSMVMLFAAFTSALLVSKPDNEAKGLWLNFNLPIEFTITTVLIVLSSLTMHWAYVSAKRNQQGSLTTALWLTAVLGVLFLAGQVIGFRHLNQNGIYFVDNLHKKEVVEKAIIRGNELHLATRKSNVSGSFLYVITGAHMLHLLGALIAVIVVLISAIRLRINSEKMLGLELCAIFWHSLDILWLYLFVFLSLTYSA